MDEAASEIEAELRAALERDPEDAAAFAVYADHLQATGELRGELAVLQLAAEALPGDHRVADAVRAHLAAHAHHYLGALDLADLEARADLGWRCGFLGEVRLRRPRADVLAALLALDTTRFLAALEVWPGGDGDDAWIARTIAAHVPPTLRTLWLGPRDAWAGDRDCELGDLGAIWPRVPHLRELGIHGRPARLGPIALPHLRRATIQLEAGLGEPGNALLEEVAAADWPELEVLHVWHGHSTELGALHQLLARTELVTLGELAILNCAAADRACSALAGSPLAPQLYRLSLAKGALTDAGVDVLVRHHAAFPSLAVLDVSETFVTPAGLARLHAIVPQVLAHDLRAGMPRPAVPPLVGGELEDDDYVGPFA